MNSEADYEEVIRDYASMLDNGTENDVKIVLQDGEIMANKDVLMIRSSYFSSMLSSNKNYVESNSGVIKFEYAKKAIMYRIIFYLFTGRKDLQNLKIEQLVEMLTLTKMMLIEKLSSGIEGYLKLLLAKKEILVDNVLLGFKICHEYNLDNLIKPFIHAINSKVFETSSIEIFKDLSVEMIKTLFLTNGEDTETPIITQLRLIKFAVWYSRNFKLIQDEDKMKILKTFDITKFTETELVVVRKCKLFTNAEVDERFLALVKNIRKQKKDLQNWVTDFEKKLTDTPNERKSDLVQRISNLRKEVANRKTSFD